MTFRKEVLDSCSDVDSQEERALAEKFFQVRLRNGLAAYAPFCGMCDARTRTRRCTPAHTSVRADRRSRMRAQETIALASPRPPSREGGVKFAWAQSPPLSSTKGVGAAGMDAARDQGASGGGNVDGRGDGAIGGGGALESVLQVLGVVFG